MTRIIALRGLVVLGLFVLGEQQVFAYVDPGSGSMLLQLLLGGVAGVAVVARMYWQRIRAFFGSRSNNTPDA
jgi:hypothetical protein